MRGGTSQTQASSSIPRLARSRSSRIPWPIVDRDNPVALATTVTPPLFRQRYGRNVSSWLSGAVGEEAGELATGQVEDLIQVLDLHQVVNGQQSLQPGQQRRGRRLDPVLHLPPGQPNQDGTESRRGRRLVALQVPDCQTGHARDTQPPQER